MDRFFFGFVIIHVFDRRTDGQTEFSLLDRVCIRCNEVKMSLHPVLGERVCRWLQMSFSSAGGAALPQIP